MRIKPHQTVIPTPRAHAAMAKLSDPTSKHAEHEMLNQSTDSFNVVTASESSGSGLSLSSLVGGPACAQCYE